MDASWTRLHAAVRHAQRLLPPAGAELAIALSTAYGAPRASGSNLSPEPDDDGGETRIMALVDLACAGDAEAFGQLYDHYLPGIYRFVYYRVGSRSLAEDLTSETFTRALRSVSRFQWQGKDFGAWLTTIARNLVTDHYRSSRSRLEIVTDVVPESPSTTANPEDEALGTLTSVALMDAVAGLPPEQRDCLLMRFVQGLSITQTATALGRSEGAVKQLQLRAVRKLARVLPREAVL